MCHIFYGLLISIYRYFIPAVLKTDEGAEKRLKFHLYFINVKFSVCNKSVATKWMKSGMDIQRVNIISHYNYGITRKPIMIPVHM